MTVYDASAPHKIVSFILLIIISIFLACYHVAKNEQNFCPFVGPSFCGAPVQPNMPKSASGRLTGTVDAAGNDNFRARATVVPKFLISVTPVVDNTTRTDATTKHQLIFIADCHSSWSK